MDLSIFVKGAIRSVGAGLIAWLLSTVSTALSVALLLPSEMIENRNIIKISERAIANLIQPILIAPIFETGIFLFVYFLLEEYFPRGVKYIFPIIMTLLGWLLHGAGILAIGRGFGFLALAVLFTSIRTRFGLAWAYMATALAHAVWNATAIGFAMFQ